MKTEIQVKIRKWIIKIDMHNKNRHKNKITIQ